MKKIMFLVIFGANLMVHAQLKIGNNTTTINNSNNLEIEATSSDKVYINKVDGRVFIENKQNASPNDSIVMSDAYGELRQISINRLLSYQDIDGDSLLGHVDLDDDGDGIADIADRCPLVYGCPSNPAGGPTHGCPVNCNFNNTLVLNCTSPTHSGAMTVGVACSGVSFTLSYTGGVGSAYSAQSVSSTGVTGLTATLSSGSFALGSGSLTYVVTGTPSTLGVASFLINVGGKTCIVTRSIQSQITFNCSSPSNSGSFTSGVYSSGTSSISYSNGGGASYSGQSISSTGVTGLVATVSSGTFSSGSGNITFSISGTPTSSGRAYFTFNIGGQSCTFARDVSGLIANFDNICPVSACMSRDCQTFGVQYNTAGGGTADGYLWDLSGNGIPRPGNNFSEGGYFDLPYTMTAGVTHRIEVRWLAFGYIGLFRKPMGFSIKTGSCTGTEIVSSQAIPPNCFGPNSTCETWMVDTFYVTPSTNINRVYFVGWGGNGGNDFVLIDYFRVYR